MKKQYLFGASALAALALASCSQEELVSIHQDGIAYEVFANNQTRTVDSYCQQNKPGSFNVWAQIADADGTLYIEGDQIKNDDPNGSGSWYDATGTRYWPQGKNLNFFAEVNGTTEFDYNNGTPKFNNFKVNPTVANQVDLMYSVNMGAINNGSPVALNFRHALSQVCFKATNNTKNLDVTINSVSVGHLTDGGTYTFPLATTDGPIVDLGHDDVNDEAHVAGNHGSWVLDNNYSNEYTAAVNGGKVVIKTTDTEKTANLTCPEENHKNGWTNVMTVMPQTVGAWNPAITGNTYNGAYFLLDVLLNDNGSNAVQIYAGKIAIPVAINWQESYRYIYTFIFNEGTNGGWTPTPDNPQPVLAGITYEVTVDDFIPVNGDGTGTNMNTGDTTPETPDTPATDPTTYNGTVTFYNADGSVAQTYTYTDEGSASVTVSPLPVVSKDNYTFMGWTTDPNPTENSTVAIDKDATSTTVTLTEAGVEIKYYPIFKENQLYPHKITIRKPSQFNVTYNGNELPYVFYNQETYNVSETVAVPEDGIVNVSASGAVFAGFYIITLNSDGEEVGTKIEKGASISVVGDVVIEPYFTGNLSITTQDPEDEEING